MLVVFRDIMYEWSTIDFLMIVMYPKGIDFHQVIFVDHQQL